VLHRCIAEYLPAYAIQRSVVVGGRGNVQRVLPAFAQLATIMPVLVAADLDSDECAPSLLTKWKLRPDSKDRLLVRIAVREIESWNIADRKRLAKFIGAQSDDIASDPDSLDDPKYYLLALARRTCPEALKRDLIPRNFGNVPRIGPAYNLQMCKYVEER
jgi:hypothetical protein